MKFGFSQPIEMRVNELVAGVKSDVAVLIYGPDLDVLRQMALEIERVLARIPGRRTSRSRPPAGCRCSAIKVRRDQLARYGIKASDVLDAVAALGGTTVGTVFEEDRAGIPHPGPPARSRGGTTPRRSSRSGSSTPRAGRSRSRDLADIDVRGGAERGRARERRSAGRSSGVNVRGRDIASFVAEAQAAIDAKVKLPARLPAPLGRPVRAPADGLAAADDRRARRAAA